MKKYLIILMLFLISGCSIGYAPEKSNAVKTSEYMILSEIPFNESACESISYSGETRGSGFGIKLQMIDSESGDELKGEASLEMAGGASSMGEAYACSMGDAIYFAVIETFSEGYSPKVFGFEVPQNKLVIMEIPMVKSCTTGKSCFENAELYANLTNRGYITYTDEVRGGVNDTISSQFGLDSSEYTLSCVECNMGRGGYILAKGKYKNETIFELYSHYGWCSSGGGDCGWMRYFISNDKELIRKEQEAMCSSISSYGNHDDYFCKDAPFENTTEAIAQCKNLLIIENTLQKISIIQKGNRCGATPEFNIISVNSSEN